MKLLQPHHAEVRHALSVRVEVRRHRVSVPCADPRQVQQVSLVERVPGLPDINVCPAPLTIHRIHDVWLAVNTVPYGVLVACRVFERTASTMYGQITHLCAPHGPLLFGFRKNILLCFLCTRMSSKLASLLYDTSGGSGNAFFIRSDACSVGRCLRKMLLMFGRSLENVVTSGTLFERFSRPLTFKSSPRSLASTFVSSFSFGSYIRSKNE